MAYGDFVRIPERAHEPGKGLRNLGVLDRTLRGLAGLALSAHVLFLDGPPGAWSLYGVLLGLYPALTAVWGWDPLYHLAGIRTCGGGRPCAGYPAQVAALFRRVGAEVVQLARRRARPAGREAPVHEPGRRAA